MRQALALSALVAGPAAARTFDFYQVRGNSCKDVHIFVSRGFNEPYPGRAGTLVKSVCGKLDSCDYENITYDNKAGTVYCDAVYEGSVNGVNQIKEYNEKCPDSKIILIGYSEGADVAGNILAGGGGPIFECTQKPNDGLGADSEAGKKIAAALVFGDVRHTANQPWNTLGGAGANGISSRTPEMLARLAAYGPALRDYCNADDGICGDGANTEDHLNYFETYTGDATDFILERVNGVSETGSSFDYIETIVTPVIPVTPVLSVTPATPALNATSSHIYQHDNRVSRSRKTITVTTTVIEDCESDDLYTQTETVTIKCHHCSHSPYNGTGITAAVVSASPSSVPQLSKQPKWTNSTNPGTPTNGFIPGTARPTASLPLPTGVLSSSNEPTGAVDTAIPNAPVSGRASFIVPSFFGLAVAVFMALL